MELTKIEMSGNEYQVDVSPHTGRFSIDAEDGTTLGTGDSLEQAKQQARTAIAKTKVKVEVPFRTFKGEHGVATSRHAKTRNVIARIGNRNEQFSGYRDRTVLKSDTPDEVIEKLSDLNRQYNSLYREREDLIREWSIDIAHEVDDAVEKAGREAVGASA